MKRFVYQSISLATSLALGMAAFAESASPNQQVLTGTVSCASRITGQYACKKGETLQSCTLECVERGSKYELVVNRDVAYLLEGNTAALGRFAGGKATVSGLFAADGNRFEFMSVSKPEKLSVARPVSDAMSAAK